MVSKKRNAIMESVLRLLEVRPLNKITVKDIVDECGINRNTFYYHFEDISSLIEAIIIDEVDRVMKITDDILKHMIVKSEEDEAPAEAAAPAASEE